MARVIELACSFNVCVGFLWTHHHFTPTVQDTDLVDFVCESRTEFCACRGTLQECVLASSLIFIGRPWPGKARWLRGDRWLFIHRSFIKHTKPLSDIEKCHLQQTLFWQGNLTVNQMFLSPHPKFKKEESGRSFGRHSLPSMGCNVRYQAPYPQQLRNITDKEND